MNITSITYVTIADNWYCEVSNGEVATVKQIEAITAKEVIFLMQLQEIDRGNGIISYLPKIS